MAIPSAEQRTAVIDLGSNSFRLVVFTAADGLVEAHRRDLRGRAHRRGPRRDRRARRGADAARAGTRSSVFAHFCRATPGDQRRARRRDERDPRRGNREEFLERARERTGLPVRVLSPRGGGPLRLSRRSELDDARRRRRARPRRRHPPARARASAGANEFGSWPLGAVRMTERFLPEGRRVEKQLKALRAHVAEELAARAVAGPARATASSASAAPSATWPPPPSTSPGCRRSAYRASCSTREALGELVDRLADVPASERGGVPGIKPARADIILAGAASCRRSSRPAASRHRGHRGGPARGRVLRVLLAARDPPCSTTSARLACCNLARSTTSTAPTRSTSPRWRLELFDELAAAGLHQGDPDRARAAVGGVHAPRHRHVGRLRRPPQALALPHPQRRPARVHAARGRAHRADRPLPPQGSAGLRGAGAAGATATTSASTGSRASCAWPRISSARATSASARAGPHAERRRPAGPPGRRGAEVARWAAEREVDLFRRAFGKGLSVAS